MAIIKIFLSLLLFAVKLTLAAKVEKDEVPNCNPNNVTVGYLRNPTDSLSFPQQGLSNLSSTFCVWQIIGNGTASLPAPVWLTVRDFLLGQNDTLTLTDDKTNQTIIKLVGGYQMPGIVYTGVNNNITINLTLSSETLRRRLKVGYSYLKPNLQIEDDDGTFVFPYFDHTGSVTEIDEFPLTFKLTDRVPYQRLLIRFDEVNLPTGSSLKIENAVNLENLKDTFNPGDLIPDILAKDDILKLTISKFSLAKTPNVTNRIAISYYPVNSFGSGDNVKCSAYKKLKEYQSGSTTLTLPERNELGLLKNFKCLWLIESVNKGDHIALTLGKGFTFLNSLYDSVVIKNGWREQDETIAYITSHNMNDWRQRNILSDTNAKLLVVYHSPQVNTSYQAELNPATINVSPKGQGGRFDGPNDAPFEVKKVDNDPNPPVVFLYETTPGKSVLLKIAKQPSSESTNVTLLNVYDSFEGNKIVFSQKQKNILPDYIVTNTNQMRIEVLILADISGSISTIESGCNVTAQADSDSYLLNGCKSSACSWFIPQPEGSNGTGGVVSIQIASLDLPTAADQIELIQFHEKEKRSILKWTGPLQTSTVPIIDVDDDFAYQLAVTRKNCFANDTATTVSASYSYFPRAGVVDIVDLAKSPNTTILPVSYPNIYPVGNPHLWVIQNYSMESKGLFAHLTFDDIQLSSGMRLTLNDSVDVGILDITNTSVLPQDYVVSLPAFLQLNSTATSSVSNGRGFNSRVSLIDCGNTVKTATGQLINPGNYSKCVWFIQVPIKQNSTDNVIEFTLDYGKDSGKQNGDLVIYDSNSIRENKFVNLTGGNFSSSTNTIVVIYSQKADKKPVNSLNLTYKSTPCQHFCYNRKYCLIDSWLCNGVNDCGDNTDELLCNGTSPLPPQPTPPPEKISRGVNGWVVLLVICPLSIALGVIGTLFGPLALRRLRAGRYSEFRGDFSEVA